MSDKKVPLIGDLVGGWGPWQWNIFLFDMSVQIFSTMNTMSIAFTAPKIDFWCLDPGFTNETSQCSIGSGDQAIACTNWGFDNSSFLSSVTSEYDIICDRAWLASLTQSLYMIGFLVSSILSGHLSDTYGRLPVLWVGVFLEILCGLSCAFSTSMAHFMISRFLLAVTVYAKFLTAFTLVMEVAGTEYRTIFGVLSRSGRAIGYITVPIVAFALRDFRYIQLAISVPEILWLIWLTRIPESPRWLLVKGHMDRAEKVVQEAARVNGIVIYDLRDQLELIRADMLETSSKGSKTFFDLWKTPVVRTNTIIMCFNWFITVFIYYALSLNVRDLGGNLFVNFFISGLVEFPAIALCIYALRRYGRRTFLSYTMLGLFLASVLGVPFYFFTFEGTVAIRVTLGMLGKFAATCAFAINYIYSSELYPTVVRQVGVGSNSAAARVGSMISPFIRELNSFTHVSVSLSIMGVMGLFNAMLVRFLPETKGREIPDTIEQVEATRKSKDSPKSDSAD